MRDDEQHASPKLALQNKQYLSHHVWFIDINSVILLVLL